MTRTMVMSQILPPLGSVVLPLLALLGGCGGEAWSTAAPPITGKSPALFTGTLESVNPSNALDRVDLSRRAPGGLAIPGHVLSESRRSHHLGRQSARPQQSGDDAVALCTLTVGGSSRSGSIAWRRLRAAKGVVERRQSQRAIGRVPYTTDQRRGSSEAEQLIRNPTGRGC